LINKDHLLSVLNSLKVGQHYRVIIKDARSRSLPQNAYYWAVVVPMVRKALYDLGYDEVKDNMDAHEVLKHLHLRKRIVSKQTGDVIDIAGSSASLTISEFNEYIENICRWASQNLDLVIPSPNQQMKDFEGYSESLEYSIDEYDSE
jgi:hypothetical protein